MAAFMYRLAGSPPLSSSAKAIVIKDGDKVSAGFETSIKWMMEEKITSINPYNPRSYVTREQMAAFMYRLAGGPELTDTAKAIVIKDADKMSAGFETSIQWMMENKITSVNPYSPRGIVTREQMAAFMYRLDSVAKERGGFDGPIGEGIGDENDDPIVGGENNGKTWYPPVYETVHHPAEYRIVQPDPVWLPVGDQYVVTCRCGQKFYGDNAGGEYEAHRDSHDGLPDRVTWLGAHGGSRGQSEPIYDWVQLDPEQELVKAAWDEEVLVREGYWA
jgi:hypothetical protein